MSSWNDKAHVAPTINVNLTPHCYDCGSPPPGPHATECTALEVKLRPVPIPCPIPRSVTFEVRLGECTSPLQCVLPNGAGVPHIAHSEWCPARPIRVACSITGATWEESEVEKVEVRQPVSSDDDETAPVPDSIFDVCRDRWALVKALVLGHTDLSTHLVGPKAVELLTQRDAVFAALVKARRHEEGVRTAVEDVMAFTDYAPSSDSMYSTPPSEAMLAHYVEHLIEQVGVVS